MTSHATPAVWVETFRKNPLARLRLLCVPYAGGGARFFRAWTQQLQSWVEIIAVQLPGRERRLREPPVTELRAAVESITSELAKHRDLPLVFFGHSMGARLAFEIARELRRQNEVMPDLLIASGHRAPQLPDPDPPIHDLPDAEFLQEVRRFNGIPDELLQHSELMDLMLPALRADFRAGETVSYTSEKPLPCSIAAYGGLQDPNVDRAALEAWREQTSAHFTLRIFPGDHFYMTSSQQLFFQLLRQELSDVAAWST